MRKIPIVHLKAESYPPHLGIAFLAFANPQPMRLSNEILAAKWFEPNALPEKLIPFSRAAIETAVSVYTTQFIHKPAPLQNKEPGAEE